MSLLVGCVTTEPPSLYDILADCAEDKVMRVAVGDILTDELHPEGRAIAEAYRFDPNPRVRQSCYIWLVSVASPQQGSWLSEGLRDPSAAVRIACVLRAHRVPKWSEAVWAAMRNELKVCRRGRVFDFVATAMTRRGGSAVAGEVFEVMKSRGAGWEEHAVGALAMHPEPRFRPVFEAAAKSGDYDVACLGRRGLGGGSAGGSAEITTREFHARWRCESVRRETPEVLAWEEMIRRIRGARVVILGELHAWLGGRASQIRVLSEMVAQHRHKVVLICERPVLEFQEPVVAAAKQYRLQVRCIEREESVDLSPSTRDREARVELARMVVAEPDKVFVVCYGENHRRSLHAAVREAGVSALSIGLYRPDGMLSRAMRRTGGKIQGLCFGFEGNSYFMPSGSYGTILGCPKLDTAFLESWSRHRPHLRGGIR